VETIKTADWGYLRLYGYRPKSVTAGFGLGCSLGCTPALSVTTALLRRHMKELRIVCRSVDLWCYINEPFTQTSVSLECHSNEIASHFFC